MNVIARLVDLGRGGGGARVVGRSMCRKSG